MELETETVIEPKSEMLDAARELKNVPWCDEYEDMILGLP